MDSWENYIGSISCQNNNNSKFQCRPIKNKNIDHRVKETCAIVSTQIAYEIDLISVLCHSTMSVALNFCLNINNTIKKTILEEI